jgi:hypothetical protein
MEAHAKYGTYLLQDGGGDGAIDGTIDGALHGAGAAVAIRHVNGRKVAS